jgi:proteasome accessory factor A
MTKDADFKGLVRNRMSLTGERYTTARAALIDTGTDLELPLLRRAFGLKTSYAVDYDGQPTMAPAEAVEYLFRRVRASGRAVNVYLENGSRLHLWTADERHRAGSAYATPECDSLVDAVAHDCAGLAILERHGRSSSESLAGPESVAPRYAFVAESWAESYLLAASVPLSGYLRSIRDFVASRWVLQGGEPASAEVTISDDPFADDQRYRRLRIVGGPPRTQLGRFVVMGATEQTLRLVESGARLPTSGADDQTPERALHTQRQWLDAARALDERHRRPGDREVLDAWETSLDQAVADNDEQALDVCSGEEVDRAVTVAPQTTRARQRGAFIAVCKRNRRDYTVDWTHLKLNDVSNRTVRCLDPLNANDERADRLLASIDAG